MQEACRDDEVYPAFVLENYVVPKKIPRSLRGTKTGQVLQRKSHGEWAVGVDRRYRDDMEGRQALMLRFRRTDCSQVFYVERAGVPGRRITSSEVLSDHFVIFGTSGNDE